VARIKNLKFVKIFFRLGRVQLILLIVGLIVLADCAYYNTFFNAKQYFKEAEKEREKRLERQKKQPQRAKNRPGRNQLSSAEIKKYDDAVKKASKVLELYPKSKYVDDALFLLGKCFFRKQDYPKAVRKFYELSENFPDSPFVPEARLWLAKVFIAQRDYESAQTTLQELINSNVRRNVIDEARYLLGGLFKNKKDYMRAVSEFEVAAKRVKDEAIRARSYFEMGECYFELKNYEKAIESYRQARKYSPDERFEYDAMFKMGLTYEKIKKYDDAIDIFKRLLNNIANQDYWPACRLEIAHSHRLAGRDEDAKFWYQDIIEKHPKSTEAADAYYYLGKIYLEREGEYEFAKENFDKAPKENPRSSHANEARAMSKSVQRLLALRDDIQQQIKRIAAGDSIAASMDSVEIDLAQEKYSIGYIDSMFSDTTHFDMDSLKIFDDSTRTILTDSIRIAFEDEENIDLRKRILKQIEIAQRRSKNRFDNFDDQERLRREEEEKKKQQKIVLKTGNLGTPQEEMLKDKVLLAEIYLFEFNQPDSALKEYLDILKIDTSKTIIPKALYSIGYIAENFKQDTVLADSMFQRLITEFPDNEFAQAARKQAKTINIPDPEEKIKRKYLTAEKAYVDERNLPTALKTFSDISEQSPTSEFAPKSLFAMGWIYENDLKNPDRAFEAYQSLVEKYPNSTYAKRVQKKVAAVEKAKKTGQQTKASPTEIAPKTDELAKTAKASPDSLGDEVDIANMTKEEYRRYLLLEMEKNDPRRKTPRRW